MRKIKTTGILFWNFEEIANKKIAFPEFGKAFFAGGDSRSRTDDPLLAKQVL